jgi:hypothetical protein
MTNLSRICVVAIVLSFATSLCAHAQGNLLLNPGLETQGAWEHSASQWDWNYPDTHGSSWGTASRETWRSHGGSAEGTIRGQWAGGSNGGWWQERSAVPGAAYTLSGWFWADNSWTSQTNQGLKIEFFSGTATNVGSMITASTNTFSGIGESWVQQHMTAVAPTNAAWVRAVVFAYNVGWDGALQFDDMSLVEESGTVIKISQLMRMLTGMMILGCLTAFRRRDDTQNS